jgi:Domain of unknown function (DUF1707)
MSDQLIRASDQERESVVDALRDAFTEGRLTAGELEERTAEAYAARTRGQLRQLTSDLPAEPLPVPGAGPVAGNGPGTVARPHRSRRRRPYDRVLPVLFVWVVIAAATGAPALAAALSFIFICMLACRIGYGGRW